MDRERHTQTAPTTTRKDRTSSSFRTSHTAPTTGRDARQRPAAGTETRGASGLPGARRSSAPPGLASPFLASKERTSNI